MIEFVLGLVAGGATGAIAVLWQLRSRITAASQPQHIDYKERWIAAVSLLGTEGSLTDDQVKTITGPPAVMRT